VFTTRAIELTSGDTGAVSDITALIEKAPPLAIHILRLADSVFQGSAPGVERTAEVLRIWFRQTLLLADRTPFFVHPKA
jgi:hypothetical protein